MSPSKRRNAAPDHCCERLFWAALARALMIDAQRWKVGLLSVEAALASRVSERQLGCASTRPMDKISVTNGQKPVTNGQVRCHPTPTMEEMVSRSGSEPETY